MLLKKWCTYSIIHPMGVVVIDAIKGKWLTPLSPRRPLWLMLTYVMQHADLVKPKTRSIGEPTRVFKTATNVCAVLGVVGKGRSPIMFIIQFNVMYYIFINVPQRALQSVQETISVLDNTHTHTLTLTHIPHSHTRTHTHLLACSHTRTLIHSHTRIHT